MKQYLAYDIKGIQQFIFSIPKLKYIVGASLLIAKFDDWAADSYNNEVIFTGGGRGIFYSEDGNTIDKIKSALVERARKDDGLDLRLGTASSFSDAVHCADDLYAFVPDSLEGEPDAVSGMLPTDKKDRIHPMIEKRRKAVGNIRNNNSFDQQILNNIFDKLPPDIQKFKEKGGKVEFLSTVKADIDDDKESYEKAIKGSESLGDRNRWAIVCLDGNDMGSQFRAFEKAHTDKSDEKKNAWYKDMSKQLDACTKGAFYDALKTVIEKWYDESCYTISEKDQLLVLPFRPLILGGDDVTAIVHSSYALDFAKTLIEKFNDLSKQHKELWVGTNGELTISAGIAYTNVSLPLHTSIPYAESLLASAKGKFRTKTEKGKPTPAAIDWEHITESMLDTPSARRHRDLVFYDEDIGTKITLMERPYDIEQLKEVLMLKEKLRNKPFSLLAECQTILTLPWAKRVQRLAAMKKQDAELVSFIQDDDFEDNHKSERTTKFLDAVSLLEEDHRLTQNTAENN